MKDPINSLCAVACWAMAMYLAWLTGPWTKDAPTSIPGGGMHDAMFHMHRPLHEGGKVAMQGQFHCEVISLAEGKHQVWISNAFRQEINPVGFTGHLTIQPLEGSSSQVDLEQVGRTTELRAQSEPVAGQAWLSLTGKLGDVVEFKDVQVFWDYELENAGIRPPLGLDPMVPRGVDNSPTPAKIELGRELFFDASLSADGQVSCGTCHQPERAFTDSQPIAIGIAGRRGRRNAPTMLNVAYLPTLGWDGAASSLEEQILKPLLGENEMGNASGDAVVARLQPAYDARMRDAFGEPLSVQTIAKALACFERSLFSGDADFDRFEAGQSDAISPAARRGRALFFGRAGCGSCHLPPLLTDHRFHNLGVDSPLGMDPGRFEVTQDEQDRGAFRTPMLRDVARTAPYMHNGAIATLREVVEFYNRGGLSNPNLDPLLEPLNLNESEVGELVEFLKTLNGREAGKNE